MANMTQLQTHARNLFTAIDTLTTYRQNSQTSMEDTNENAGQLTPPSAPQEVHDAREAALASITMLQSMLAEPTDFLQQMARQVNIRSPLPEMPPVY